MEFIKFNYEKKYINDFLNFSKKIYTNDLTEDKEEVKKLLLDNHPLSKYFKLVKYLIYDKGEVVGRFTLTIYPDDENIYLGLFECINDKETSKYLFDLAYNYAKENNFKKIVGPVDCSFWIKYRLKINLFDKVTYTGEPYNKDYYLNLFLDNKYKVTEHYTSNIYKIVDYDYINEKYSNRYDEFINKGYVIKSPKLEDFSSVLDELYYLLTDLYKDFPIFKNVSKEDFVSIFKSYKKIMTEEMVKIAYFNNKMVGFFISVPNYNNLVYNINLFKLLKILKLRRKPKEYVMLYMGVDSEHKGLGKALAYSIINELRKSKLTSIGALARDGKVTQNYAEDLIDKRYEYVLLERIVK